MSSPEEPDLGFEPQELTAMQMAATPTTAESENTTSSPADQIPGGQSPEEQGPEEQSPESQESPAELVPEGVVSGAAIGAGEEQQAEDDEAEDEGVFLGDRYKVISKAYGETKGRIYYNDPDSLIRIMPDGVSNIVQDFKIVDGDFDPDLGIDTDKEDSFVRIGKGPRVGFVELNGFRVGQVIDTFIGGSGGALGKTYTITNVNAEDDKIIIEELESKEPLTINFNFIGIPLDLPFNVIRIKQLAEPEERPLTAEQQAAEEAQLLIAQAEGAESAAILGQELEFEDLGEFDLFEVAVARERAAADVIYPEDKQKSELLADLVSLLDVPSQRNPLLLKRIRALVEMASSLKNSVVKYSRDGTPDGQKTISVGTLADVLQGRNVPLARPILTTKRIVYSELPDVAHQELDQVVIENLVEQVKGSEEFLEVLGSLPAGEPGVGLPRWYQALQSYFKRFPLGDTYSGSSYTFPQDGEYFRHAAPETTDLEGLRPGYEGENPEIHIGIIESSLRRAHGPTQVPMDKGVSTAITATKANAVGYVLFPYKTAIDGALGATRTGRLWDAILRSASEKTWMNQIVQRLGGVTDERDAQKILVVGQDDRTAIGVPFAEYLKLVLQTIVPRGPGDLFAMKFDLGIQDAEPDLEQAAVIEDRVKEVLASLKGTIRSMREGLAATKATPEIKQLLTDQYVSYVMDLVKTHPLLDEIVKHVAQRTPGYKQVDIAVTASLMKYAQDYFFAVLGGDRTAIERERIRAVRDKLMMQLWEGEQLLKLKRNLGKEPQPNPCEHTDTLTIIRKEKDDTRRMGLLTKFLGKYQGGRTDNWITCLLCKKHLICHHEVLQVQQFLHPREADVIQKEIVLNFAGGAFGTKHICRNCGLPIAELEYDKNLEFNDEGVPMIGRDVLVDKDAMAQEALEALFGIPIEKETEVQYETAEKTEVYQILKVLCDRIGITIDGPAYTTLIDRVAAELSQTIKAAEYEKLPASKRAFTYTQFLAQTKIAVSSALLLIHIQSHRPDYIVRFLVEGCRPGFGGFPLVAEADPESTEQSPGINYMACAITGIKLRSLPWSNGFQIIASDEKRKDYLKKRILAYVKHFAEDAGIQTELEKKRTYLRETFGAAAAKGRPSEVIPSNFLPQMSATEEPGASVPEGARGGVGEALKADAWIRGAHAVARKTATVIKGSPFAESACCYSAADHPDAFWKEAEASLPPLPEHFLLKPPYKYQSILYTPMIPRELQIFEARPSLDIAYRVFMRLCYKGLRVGLPHELNYTHTCDWCDMYINPKFLYPDINLKGELIFNEDEARASLESQGVVITEQTFQALLDANHNRNRFKRYVSPRPVPSEQVLKSLGELEYPPFGGFAEALREAEAGLIALSPTAAGVEVARALLPISQANEAAEAVIKRRLGQARLAVVQRMMEESVQSCLEGLRTYFLVPFERILTNYNNEDQLFVPAYYKLAAQHRQELDAMLITHTAYLNQYQIYPEDPEDTSLDKAQVKLKIYVEQMGPILAVCQELRLSRVRFDAKLTTDQMARFLRELVRAVVLGPLSQLIDPEYMPVVEGVEVAADAGNSDTFIVRLVNELLITYNKERLAYNPLEVKKRIEEAKERERQRFVDKLDRLGEDERKVELMKKRLGLGDWAIGGTKLVYMYDADQWEKNREAIAMDYSRAAGAGNQGLPEEAGPQYDAMGLAVGGGREEGYDVQFGDPSDEY